jgi:glyoxylase-like metal-dependent hydrolase (beta-lactamase superfamily II)
VPTFPKSKYLFGKRELAFWTEEERSNPGSQPWIVDSVLPIIEAKRHEEVDSDYELSDVVNLIATPGHTVGHFSVHVGQAGADAINSLGRGIPLQSGLSPAAKDSPLAERTAPTGPEPHYQASNGASGPSAPPSALPRESVRIDPFSAR